MASTLSLLDDQKVTANLLVTDSQGSTATLPAGVVPTWVMDTTTICTVDSSGDPTGMSAIVTAVGPVGTAILTVSAVMSPTSTITATATITVSVDEGNLVLTISFAPPVSK